MFSSLGLFKEIDCPEASKCNLPNCIFLHIIPSDKIKISERQPRIAENTSKDEHDLTAPRKRRRISPSGKQTGAKLSVSQLPQTALRDISPPPFKSTRPKPDQKVEVDQTPDKLRAPTFQVSKPNPSTGKSEQLSLNPRMLSNSPMPYPHRRKFVEVIHQQLTRLNNEVTRSEHKDKARLELSTQDLVRTALEEEETIAKANGPVYRNVISNRITKLKKMGLAEWIGDRLKLIQSYIVPKAAEPVTKKVVSLDAGLDVTEQYALLPMLFADQQRVARYGYVANPPTVSEKEQARQGVEAGQGWEVCERCRTRFQMFPGRRAEDGALTSGGACIHHPERPRRAEANTNLEKSYREAFFTCCGESVGQSTGCTTSPTHVFKISDPKRLELVMPFERTPTQSPDSDPEPSHAVCFDCEMGYTTLGLELIRLTATSWPDGRVLVDVLVRPLGEILDLNSRYSGVWPQDFSNALDYEDENNTSNKKSTGSTPSNTKNATTGTNPPLLRKVSSPAKARDLLFAYLTPTTPLMGHALDNDLNATRIIHPSIIDTVLLYPHPRGLPIRNGLKMLMKRHLDKDIQTGGALEGHDSAEDARAAGELVQLHLGKRWERMKADGWTFDDNQKSGKLIPPEKERDGKLARMLGVEEG